MKPIIFNTEMVQAILAGRKTQTRRVVTVDLSMADTDRNDPSYLYIQDSYGDHHHVKDLCRYQPGDILWVRETWTPCATIESWLKNEDLYAYKADYSDKNVPWKWRPSIHMPKAAARLFLRVTDIRMEQLQDITEEDCLAEGIRMTDEGCEDNGWAPTYNDPDSGGIPNLKNGYRLLWDRLNAKRGYGWGANPYVWVIEFERISKDETNN